MTGLLFSKGKSVEVSLQKEEYPEVWFPATVQEETGNGYLVERHIRQNDGVPESVKVIIDYLHIRPSPPQVNVTNYLMSEKVDAYIDFGWWNGVITKELLDNKYMVRVKRTKIEMQVNQSEIRPHMEWKDGSWFSAAQEGDQVEGQGNTIQRRKRGRPRKNLGKSLEVSQPNGDVAAAGMASKYVPKNYALPATNLNGSSPNKKNVNLDVGKQISYGSVEQNST